MTTIGFHASHEQPHASVQALRSAVDDVVVIRLHNFSSDPLNVPLARHLDAGDYRLIDLIEDGEIDVGGTGDAEV